MPLFYEFNSLFWYNTFVGFGGKSTQHVEDDRGKNPGFEKVTQPG